jgi:hypothetical protein
MVALRWQAFYGVCSFFGWVFFHFGTNDFDHQLMMLNWVLAWVVVAVLN